MQVYSNPSTLILYFHNSINVYVPQVQSLRARLPPAVLEDFTRVARGRVADFRTNKLSALQVRK
jgi:hypothetical protein